MTSEHTPTKIDNDTFTYRGLTMCKTTRSSNGNHRMSTWAVYYSNGCIFEIADTKPKLMKKIDEAIFSDYDAFIKPAATFTGFTWKFIKDGVVHIGESSDKTAPDFIN